MEPIGSGLSAIQPEQLNDGMLSAVFSLPAVLLQSERLKSLREKSTIKLVAIFGNVPAIIRSGDLRKQFCGLPYEAVLTWLKVM